MYGQQNHGQPPNPYAPPVEGPPQLGAPGQHGVAFWRQGHDLVVRKGAVLPDRCIVTGVATHGNAVTKELTWVPPWVVILCVAVSPIIGLIVMVFVRKKGGLTYFVAPEAQAKRRTGVLMGVGLIVGSFALFGVAIAAEIVSLFLFGFVAILAGIIVAATVGVPYKVTKIDEEHIHLRVKPEFWAGLG